MQKHGEFARNRDSRTLLPVLATTLGARQTKSPQVAIRSERTQDVVAATDQEPTKELVPRLGDPQLRNSFYINEALLLLNALAYNLAHAARVLMERATGEGWSLQRFRERVLRVAGRLLLHGRRATLVLGSSAAKLWAAHLSQLRRLHYVGT